MDIDDLYEEVEDLKEEMEERFTDFTHKINRAIKAIEECQRNNEVGVQNVYAEFRALTDGSIIASAKYEMKKMEDKLMSVKRELEEDVRFVRKCYKIMPVISKIKELDDEDYEKLVKILELMN
jgi:enolase